MTELSQIIERLERLEAREQIAELMAQYLYLADREVDPVKISDLFTEDAVWEPRGNLAEMAPTRGRAAIGQLFADLPQMLTFTAHYVTNAVISLSDDGHSASGRWHAFELLSTKDPKDQIVQIAWYHNDFVREDDGWRIKHIRFEDSLSFPFSEGWANTRFVSLVDLRRDPHPSS